MARSIGTNLQEWESKPLSERFDVWDTLEVSGREITFYTATTQMLLSTVGRLRTIENIQDALSVIGHLVEEQDYHHILRSLHTGALNAEDLIEAVITPMVEDVLGTPTPAASASTRRPSRTGTGSTAGAPRGTSTRPRSRRVEPST